MKAIVRIYQFIINQVGRYLHWGAMTILGFIAIVTLLDVIGRTLFNNPINGGYELTELMLAVLFSLGAAKTEIMKSNVKVDLLMTHVRVEIRRKVNYVNNLVSSVICLILGWNSIQSAYHIKKVGTTSGTLDIPLYPFIFLLGFGIMVMGGVFLSELFEEKK